MLCEGCLQKMGVKPPLPLIKTGNATLYSATRFNPNIKRVLYSYKFYEKREYQDLLSEILNIYWQELLAQANHQILESRQVLVTCIPQRVNSSRRFEHLSPLAERFAHQFGYSFIPGLLQWTRETTPQHTLTGKRERLENIKGSIDVPSQAQEQLKRLWQPLSVRSVKSDSLKSTVEEPTIIPRQIIIIDDLTTTGATLMEAFQALQRGLSLEKQPEPVSIIGYALCHVPLAFHRSYHAL
jgi:predicted amidophosphoribosyltransferase